MTTESTALQVSRDYPEIEAAITELINSRRALNTRKAYRADWDRWRDFVRQTGSDLARPGLAISTRFRDGLVADGYKAKSIGRILSTLSQCYAALRDAGLPIGQNPFARTWLPRPETSDIHKTPAIEDTAVDRLLATIRTDRAAAGPIGLRAARDLAIILILYDSGMRRESLASLEREKLRHEGKELSIIVWVKGGKERFVKFTQRSAAALLAWLELAPSSSYVFPHRSDPHDHIALSSLNKILHERAEQAGLDPKTVHPHRFRAGLITDAYSAKINERDIQTAAHHASATTTRGYDRGQRGGGVYDQVLEFRQKGKS